MDRGWVAAVTPASGRLVMYIRCYAECQAVMAQYQQYIQLMLYFFGSCVSIITVKTNTTCNQLLAVNCTSMLFGSISSKTKKPSANARQLRHTVSKLSMFYLPDFLCCDCLIILVQL